MRPVFVKVYGSLHPAGRAALAAVSSVLADWYIPEAVELKGDLLRISHEGEYFPVEDVVDVLRPLLSETCEGKLDYLDLEAWSLRRFFFRHGRVSERTASLDRALESCAK
ncbi:MAG: hypothetical protein J1E80_02800 [Desulfovibrionaceae bacterium]|nr:hypothetical protein [Desulfovibrionaceae bacterium]